MGEFDGIEWDERKRLSNWLSIAWVLRMQFTFYKARIFGCRPGRLTASFGGLRRADWTTGTSARSTPCPALSSA